jgi:adenine-specific DNA-methyltransferase
VAEDALSERGEPQREHPAFQARLAKELLEEYEGRLRALDGMRASEAQQAEVFNHLYAFFSRYHESSDFIPRRYGAREAYAVPRNWETLARDHNVIRQEGDYIGRLLGGPF